MDPVLQDKLLNLVVNFVSFLLAGGVLTLFIEWRRHKRESQVWAREDKFLEIDIPRAEMRGTKWVVDPKMSADKKLTIYENKLEGLWRYVVIAGTFVIRNTTNTEIVVVDYDADALNLPVDEKRFYDLETMDLLDVKAVGPLKLRPLAAITRLVVMEAVIDQNHRLETLPTTISIRAVTSSGTTIQQTATLNLVPAFPDVEQYGSSYHPKGYITKLRAMEADETEIPF
jgi:hypothetical protein